jgi:hypothetical protein
MFDDEPEVFANEVNRSFLPIIENEDEDFNENLDDLGVDIDFDTDY